MLMIPVGREQYSTVLRSAQDQLGEQLADRQGTHLLLAITVSLPVRRILQTPGRGGGVPPTTQLRIPTRHGQFYV
jgi:hypothetical protein